MSVVVSLLFGAAAIAFFWFPLWEAYKALRPYFPTRPHPVVDMIEALIRADRDWQKTRHTWFHPSGVCLWVASGKSHLSVRLGARDGHDWARDDDPDKQGVPLTIPQRAKLWKAVKRIEKRGAELRHQEGATVTAERLIAMYGHSNVVPIKGRAA